MSSRTPDEVRDFRDRVAATRQNPDLAHGTLGGVEMFQAVLHELIEQDHDAALTEHEQMRYFAEVGWDRSRIGVYAETSDDTSESLGEGDVEPVDLDDNTPDGYDRQHAAVAAALRPLGWEPEPGAEWLDLAGGLGWELGGLRVEVRRIVLTL